MEQAQKSSSQKVFGALLWKFFERIGVNGMQFVLQVILARMLSPDHYGVLSMMMIFVALARVFVQRGFNTALVQNKDVTDEDYSSVFWATLLIAGILYVLLFFLSPVIAKFYEVPEIKIYLRVLALILFPGALNSVQIAKLSRDINFRKIFIGNIAGIVLSGLVGVVVAYLGGGVWALVAYNLLNVSIACITMRMIVKLKLRLVCNFSRLKELFSFGWKILVASLIDTLYQDIRSLVVGKKYSAGDLGYYERGKQFPQFVTSAINTSVQSVMLPVMSKKQTELEQVKAIMRKSVSMSSYIILPMLAGMAAVAEPVVRLLLGEKWLPCVPFMQVYCFTMAFVPIHSCNLQAISAMGRSGINLILEIIKKVIGLIALVIATFCFQTPLAIAMTGVFTTVISFFVNAYPNKKLIGYSYFEQIKDVAPPFVMSVLMAALVLLVGWVLPLPTLLSMLVQILAGVAFYVLTSVIFKVSAFKYLFTVIKGFLKK